jgi:hypothetical protein
MFALHLMPHQLEAFRVLIVILAGAGLVFWRVAYKIIVAALVLCIVSGIAAFMFGFLEGMYHFLR